ncbi:hypothetical protein OCH239_09680 [Roseivivax halodurans JCM 10272]|uniref:Uncharacterized protein n=1 Tax=Roseivivax halodurans JCM 10272 TaxID=1449350 RepID=X7EBS7_9RHOB|nr:hypothetical protein [Roseivivax halodurans]ETX13539.1 hypothetical protein OCH239_09680 [Roseivivax halodurans JCM 10272]
MSRRGFFSTCVGWPEALHAAKDWLDERAEPITRQTFLRLVDRADMTRVERELGYGPRLQMASDPYVSYYREPHSGIPYFVWSAIEHVFAERAEIEALDRHAREDEMRAEAGLLVIDRLGLMAGSPPSDPDYDGDLEDEAIDRLITHDGALVVTFDARDATLPPYLSLTRERALAHAARAGAVRVWCGDGAPPEAWTGHPERVDPENLRAFVEGLGLGLEVDFLSPQHQSELVPSA